MDGEGWMFAVNRSRDTSKSNLQYEVIGPLLLIATSNNHVRILI